MIAAGSYSGYVLAAYGLSALVLLGLGAFVLLDARRRRRELKVLEDGGSRRRSAGSAR